MAITAAVIDGRDVRRIVTPWYALSDLIFVPAGVLAALFEGHLQRHAERQVLR